MVKRSQPWISGVKRERNLITFAQERGRQEAKDEIIKRVEDKTAQNLSKHLFQGTNVPKIEADTK